MQYTIILEKTDTGYSVYSPDIPGCVSTGKTKEEAQANMQEAIEFHIEGLKIHGYPIPEPTSATATVAI